MVDAVVGGDCQEIVIPILPSNLSPTQGGPSDIDDIFAAGDRATQRRRYSWMEARRARGHIRDGKIAEKVAQVKG